MAALAGCAPPNSMHIRKGVDPRNQDDDVRFRTTYYFRVFDVCDLTSGPVAFKKRITSDSLYRFRMTGKAVALTSDINFESGTLRAIDIDPFGASVAFNPETGNFAVLSPKEAADADKRARAYAEIAEVEKLNLPPESKTDLKNAIKEQLTLPQIPTRTVVDAANLLDQPQRYEADCVGTSRRGFQILGPEGWRTFDQHERLVMAMSSRAKPLIDTMRELSSRVLNDKKANVLVMTPLLRERTAVHRARLKAETADADTASDEIVKSVLDAYSEVRK